MRIRRKGHAFELLCEICDQYFAEVFPDRFVVYSSHFGKPHTSGFGPKEMREVFEVAQIDSIGIDPTLPGDTWALMAERGTTGQGTGIAVSGNFILATGTVTDVPDLSLNVTVSRATAGVVVTTDGGIQMNSAIVGSYAFVDITLLVDVPATATRAASTKVVARRRVFAENAVTQQAVTNWSISTVCVEPPGGPYTYHVAAQLVANNAPVIVSGSSTVLNWLRGTLTATVINK